MYLFQFFLATGKMPVLQYTTPILPKKMSMLQ